MNALRIHQEGGVPGVELWDELLDVCGQGGGRLPGVCQRGEAAICGRTHASRAAAEHMSP